MSQFRDRFLNVITQRPQSAVVKAFSPLGVDWLLSPREAGEGIEAWLKRMDSDFYARLKTKLDQLDFELFEETYYRLPGQTMNYLNSHPARKNWVREVMVERLLQPIKIEMSEEQFNATYRGTWLFEKKEHDCPIDATAAAFLEGLKASEPSE